MKPERPSEIKIQAGLRLRAARLALEIMRQDVMAARLNVPLNTYNHWELGKRLPDPLAMVRLFNLFGVGPDWIYAGSMRAIPYILHEPLVHAAAEVGAAMHGPTNDFPMAADKAPVPRPRTSGAVPKRAARTLHERGEPVS